MVHIQIYLVAVFDRDHMLVRFTTTCTVNECQSPLPAHGEQSSFFFCQSENDLSYAGRKDSTPGYKVPLLHIATYNNMSIVML
jgi:hypothetical protein